MSKSLSERVARFDAGSKVRAVRLDSGFLRVPATLGKVGVVAYQQPDGTVRRELRLPEELFRADSLETLEMVPVTLEHPAEKLVTTANVKDRSIGHVGDKIRQDGDFVAGSLLVTSPEAIKAIEGGKREISPCYFTQLEFAPGVHPKFGPYDAIQRNVEYNHVAIVERGRAGDSVRLHMDAADAIEIFNPSHKETVPMEKINLDGVDFELTPQLKQAVNAALAKRDAQVAEAVGKLSPLQARADAADAELVKERKLRQDAADPAKIQAAVKSRLDLERAAAPILGTEIKLDAMTDAEIKAAVVVKVNPALADKVKGADASYLQASYDFALAAGTRQDAGDSLAQARRAAEAGTETQVNLDSEGVRAKFAADQREAWKKPLTIKAI